MGQDPLAAPRATAAQLGARARAGFTNLVRETVTMASTSTACPVCGGAVPVNGTGRPRIYCHDQCRWRAGHRRARPRRGGYTVSGPGADGWLAGIMTEQEFGDLAGAMTEQDFAATLTEMGACTTAEALAALIEQG
jgi:hypothetical protein